MSRVSRFASSPRGRKLTDKVQKLASDPKTRAQIDNARRRVSQRRGRGGGRGPA